MSEPARGVVPELTLPMRMLISRLRVDLDQRDMATKIGVAERTVRRYEKGERPPRRGDLMLWAHETGVDFHWLETGQAEPPDGAPDEIRNRWSPEIVSHPRRLSVLDVRTA